MVRKESGCEKDDEQYVHEHGVGNDVRGEDVSTECDQNKGNRKPDDDVLFRGGQITADEFDDTVGIDDQSERVRDYPWLVMNMTATSKAMNSSIPAKVRMSFDFLFCIVGKIRKKIKARIMSPIATFLMLSPMSSKTKTMRTPTTINRIPSDQGKDRILFNF